MFNLKISNTIKKMVKSTTLLLGLFVFLVFSVSSQTFTNNTGQAYNTWNSNNTWATSLSRTVLVSGLSNPLSAGGTVLKQVNLKLGDGTSVNLTTYSIRLTSPSGTVISIVSLGNFNATTAYNVDIKYRDDNLLQFPSNSNQNPYSIGYYRTTTANSFSTVNGENPNGNWVLEIVEGTTTEIAFVSVDLVFGTAIVVNDVSGTTTNDDCSTPQCMGESSVVKATISSYTGNANDPNTLAPYPGGCNWNGAHNNSAWFVFKPSATTAKVTISGISNSIQTLIVDETNACVAGSQTVPTGGCPIDAVNDTYTSPRYTPSSGSSSNEQFNLSGLIPGNKYYLVVDGNGGLISPLYIELSGGLVDLCCATIISGSTDVCAGSASTLYSQLGGALGGTWSVTPVSAGTIDAAGNFTPGNPLSNVSATISYDDGSCTKTFSVTVHAAPIAGTVGSITVCSNGSSVNLFSSLGGSPSSSGIWSGPSVLTGGNLGTYNPVTLTAGAYTYTVSETSCTNASAIVTVTETTAPDAGTAGSITLCANGSSVNLFSSLGGTPVTTGTWSGPSVLAGGYLGTYDPSTLSPGAYTYTVTAASCPNATAIVTVTESAVPNAGTSGTITLCSNGASVNLFASLGGTPASTGVWTGPSVLVGGNLGTYNPVTLTPGIYTYTVSATSCTDATASVTVTETTAPDAGLAGSISLCSNGSSVNLYSSLGGSPFTTGVWTGSSALAGGYLGTYDPSILTPGVYTYTVSASSCADATALVTVTETVAPNAGIDGVVTICSIGASQDLFTILGGSPDITGTWSISPSALGGAHLGTYDPTTMAPGTYTYTVLATAPCLVNDIATVVVTEVLTPDAGVDAVVTVCANGSPIDLFNSLTGTPNIAGTWSGTSTLTGAYLGTYDPTTMTPGIYTYAVIVPGCVPSDFSTVTVTETPVLNAGIDATVTICSVGASQDLFTLLAGSPDITGTWSPSPSTLGGAHLGTYDPLTMTPGTYTYTIAATGGCLIPDFSTVVVTEVLTPNAGVDGVITVCENGASVDLFSSLTGTPGTSGTWSGTSTLTGAYLGTYDPTTMVPGVYTYSVIVPGCVPSDFSTVTITESTLPLAGVDGAITVCSNGSSIDLFSSLTGSPNTTGTWSGPSVLVGGYLGTYNPSTLTPGSYVYTVSATSCSNDISTVIVTETTAPNAGVDGAITVCSNGSSIDLFSSLTGSPNTTGTWTGTSVLTGGYLGTYDPSTFTAGIYTYTVAATACVSDISTVTVTESIVPDAGIDGVITVCSNGSSIDLYSSLTGSPLLTGTWSGPSVLVGGYLGTYDPSSLTAGSYTYTVSAIACSNDVSTVVVTETTAPNAGVDGVLTVCSSGAAVNLFSSLSGSPDIVGIWTGPSVLGGAHLGTYTPSTLTAGIYTYTVSALACSDDVSTVNVTVTLAPASGIASVLDPTLCSGVSTIAASTIAGGVWSSSDVGVATVDMNTGLVVAINAGTTTLTYTVLGTAGCLGTNATSTVDVVVTDTPIAPTGNLSQGFCEDAVATVADLSTLTGANIQWYDASNSGVLLANSTILENGTHYFATQTIAGCESVLSLDVLVYLDSIQLALVSQTTSACSQQTGSATVLATNGIGSYAYLWSNSQVGNTNTNVGSGEYSVTVTDSLGCSSSLGVTIFCDGIIPEIITPNGDGKNDTWIINVDSKVLVQLYNRWGNLIYTALPYLDDWEGKANEGVTLGNDYLPNGTYFYVIDYKNGSEPVSGYIELIR